MRRQDLERHFATKLVVIGSIDLAHAPRAKKLQNTIGTHH
jgi:hypothetical protein